MKTATEPPEGSPYPSRVERLRAALALQRLNLFLVSSLPNVHYLTGFSGSSGAVVVTDRTSILFTDSRYDIQAHEEVRHSDVKIVKGDAVAVAVKWSRRYRERTLGFEAGAVSYAAYQRLGEFIPSKRLVAASSLVETLRITKDEGEIGQIRRAVDVGSRAFSETLRYVKLGVTELDLAAEIEYRMRRYGAERPAFETIIAFGDHAALPHARPGARKLAANECILMDLGAILGGYAGDMSRTVFFGTPSRRAAKMYRAVLEAQLAGENAVAAGVACSAVDGAARLVLERHGIGQYFTHSTGHGVGREIHESPRIAPKQPMRLPEGAVITVEPGVYIPGFGGVRIEDVVVVRKQGAEVLTRTPKELTVL